MIRILGGMSLALIVALSSNSLTRADMGQKVPIIQSKTVTLDEILENERQAELKSLRSRDWKLVAGGKDGKTRFATFTFDDLGIFDYKERDEKQNLLTSTTGTYSLKNGILTLKVKDKVVVVTKIRFEGLDKSTMVSTGDSGKSETWSGVKRNTVP